MDSENNIQEPKPKKKRKVLKIILITLLILILSCTAAAAGIAIAVIKSVPPLPTGDLIGKLNESSKIFDRDGNFIEDISSSENRHILSYDKIPQHLKDAFISIEDERFETHPGVDIKRLVGATLINLKRGSFSQGGSTITQQLVKNTILTQEKTLIRKFQEIYLALQLERKYEKDQILEAYLNIVWLGGTNYGVDAGSMYFFGKSATELDLAECALIAGINPNASLYDPFNIDKIAGLKKRLLQIYDDKAITDEEYNKTLASITTIFADLLKNQDYDKFTQDITPLIEFMKSKDPILNGIDEKASAGRASYYKNVVRVSYKERQELVLKKMLELGKITQEEHDKAVAEKLVFQTKEEAHAPMKYQWFIEPAIDQIAADYAAKYGGSTTEAKRALRTGGFKIQLTLDPKLQEKTEAVLNDPKYYPKGFKDFSMNNKDPKFTQPQAATVVMDVATGELHAVVGGRGDHPLLSYNRATDPDVARQPGSAIKPLSVYAPALETKIATPGTVYEDSPLTQEQVDLYKGWDPRNYNNRFNGYMTVRDAVRLSTNTVAVKLGLDLGVNNSIKFLTDKFHLSTIVTSGANNDKSPSALSLGGLTKGVTPLEMTAAYSVFANNGIYSEPIYYTKVTDSDGNIVLEKSSAQSKAISAQAAYLMADMLKTVVKSGTGTKASLGKMPAGGKTGTTDKHTNGWYMGITPYYSCGIWIGHDNKNVEIKSLVGGTAAPMWKEIMLAAHEGLEVKDFTKPSGIVRAPICIDSGMSPTDLCKKDPRGSRVRTEMFIDGTQPVQMCDIHVEQNIDKSTGKLATEFCPPDLIVPKIFIIRATPARKPLADDKYVLPSVTCDVHTTIQPTATPSPTPTEVPTVTEKPTATPTPKPTQKPSPTAKPTEKPPTPPSPSPSPTPAKQ